MGGVGKWEVPAMRKIKNKYLNFGTQKTAQTHHETKFGETSPLVASAVDLGVKGFSGLKALFWPNGANDIR
ncbi:MAG: hypothetical protein CM15mP95_1720 [Alphaproteobacteria bacterium]|nr:MAG: hypothetical protein CM15mP95_1720 [Alphaproteobacteria bacterium]